MSTLVISDTHLTKKFDQKKYCKLVDLINNHDNIIINGDFWEGLQISFDEFINSGWNKLFSLLKQKDTTYIYGNHDRNIYSDDRINLFCTKAVEDYDHKIKNINYFFTHGDKLVLPPAKEKRSLENVRKHSSVFLERVFSSIHELLIIFFGPNVFPSILNSFKESDRNLITSKNNLLVCGHSHKQQHNKAMNFIDIGFFNYGWANYLTIDNNGAFKLHQEKY